MLQCRINMLRSAQAEPSQDGQGAAATHAGGCGCLDAEAGSKPRQCHKDEEEVSDQRLR